jgi:N-acetylneuraminic acid mutarotase
MKRAARLGLLVLLAFGAAACQHNEEVTTSPHKWMWASGAETVDQAGVYGTQGTAAATNVPGSREGGVSWRDPSGRFWLFGGYGFDAQGYRDRLNDLWMYDPAASVWTWISGSDTIDAAGVYGTKGVAAAANVPGARNGAASWVDGDGNFWLFGGLGYSGTGMLGHLNDLWKFEPGSGLWTWISGGSGLDLAGSYGTLGVAGAANVPGARLGASSVVDADGRLRLFGGFGHDAAGAEGWLNDLWEFDPAAGQWTWAAGVKVAGATGDYGTVDVAASSSLPGARVAAVSWTDGDGGFWLFGGYGVDSAGATRWLNDLWTYDATSGEWTWISGSSVGGADGIYGTLGTADSANVPGSRYSPVNWIDAQGHLWLFGGYGADSKGAGGLLNDLWRFTK